MKKPHYFPLPASEEKTGEHLYKPLPQSQFKKESIKVILTFPCQRVKENLIANILAISETCNDAVHALKAKYFF